MDALVTYVKKTMGEHDEVLQKGWGSYNVSGWHDTDHASLHVRSGLWWTIDTGVVHSFSILRIEVRHRGRGFFKRLLSLLEDLCDHEGRVLRVENIVAVGLAEWLTKRGYATPSNEPTSRHRMPQPPLQITRVSLAIP